MDYANMTKDQRLAAATAAYSEFCQAVGVDLTLEDTRDTPRRVAKLFINEFTVGTQRDVPFTFTTFPANKDAINQLVSVTGIRFNSLCRHHHLPVIGYAHVGYLPGTTIAGLSKIPRFVQWKAAAPSVQEELTSEILDGLTKILQPRFCAVTLIAKHTCMACRGVHDYESRTTTTKFSTGAGFNVNADPRPTFDEFQRSVDLWYKNRDVL